MAASSSSSPMQAYVETSDWLKCIVQDDGGACAVDAISSPSSELLQCIPAPQALQVVERRLRPQHEQALRCPRCDSTHTKFCYYNNYSLSQPRYFCKTCRRYWTKGGSLRNVPVGGGCRKNKRSSSAAAAASKIIKPTSTEQGLCSVSSLTPLLTSYNHEADTDLHLSFPPGQQLPPFEALLADAPRNLNFMEFRYNHGLEHGSASTVFDFIESKFGAVFGSSTAMGSNGFNGAGFASSFPADGVHASFGQAADAGDVKPGNRLLSLEWQEQQGCAELERTRSVIAMESGCGRG
ncbi:hypothetical protein HPP92_003432 [Vanilla planifolia]|uniref:Dof zinc finger protein n=1 Tax=Vanilla planifolia TaxID=51239 RepID=A0A835S2Z9_VANPL|nr:hypothetical protein HPP92_003432 [Vanilla planifolia]